MPTSNEQTMKFLRDQYALFFPKLTRQEQETLRECYALEIDRLSEICLPMEKATKSQLRDLELEMHQKAIEEQFRTLNDWVEGGLTPLKVMFIGSLETYRPIWIQEAIRRTEWAEYMTEVRIWYPQGSMAPIDQTVQDWVEQEKPHRIDLTPVDTFAREDMLDGVHGLIAITDGKKHGRVDKFIQRAVHLGIRVYVYDTSRARIRRSRVPNVKPE